MAPKRLLEDPPSAASDSEETEETELENDAAEDDQEDNASDEPEDDEDGDDDQLSKKPAAVSALSTPSQKQRIQSDSGDESDSDSDTESDKTQVSPSASAFTVKPVAAKPTDMKSSSAKRNLNLAAATPTVASGSKRTSHGDIEGNDSKKKKVSNGNDEEAKKGHFQRIWTVDDEVAILKGMIEFQSKRGVDPLADMGVFYKFLKNNLHADMSEKQLMDKIRRLKKKYQNNAKKGENGEDPVLSKPHELKCYELSKKIWGAAASNRVDENAKKKKPTQSRVKNSSALASPNANLAVKKDEEVNGEANDEVERPSSNSSLLNDLLVSGKLLNSQPEGAANIMKEALPLIGSAEAKELERKWKNLQEEEFELYLKRMELVHKSAKLLWEAKKSSKF